MRKETKELVEFAAGLGWEFDGFARSGHVRLRHTGIGRSYRIPATPSDSRSVANSRAALRRMVKKGAA